MTTPTTKGTGTALIYLRKSRVDEDKPGVVSHEKQTEMTRALAAGKGYPPGAITVYEDWGKSGGEGRESKRAQYLALKDRIKAVDPLPLVNGVRVAPPDFEPAVEVFAYDQSRLTRSVKEWAELADVCAARGVPVHLAKGGTTDFLSATGRLVSGMLSQINQFIVEVSREHKAETDALKRRQNIAAGRPEREGLGGRQRYADLQVVLDAYEEAGSYMGAATLLNALGVPTGNALLGKPGRGKSGGGPEWTATTVSRLVLGAGVGSKVVRTRRGSRVHADHPFTGLLRCHCGATLSSMVTNGRGGRKRAAYICNRARTDSTHGLRADGTRAPYQLTESRVTAFLDAKINAVLNSDDYGTAVASNAEVQAERAVLADERRRIGRLVLERVVEEADGVAALAMLDARSAALEAAEEFAALPFPLVDEVDPNSGALFTITGPPRIDWAAPVGDLNKSLRTAIKHVQLDEDFNPSHVEWRITKWLEVAS